MLFRNLPLGVTIMLGEPFSNGLLKARSTVGADRAKKQNTVIISNKYYNNFYLFFLPSFARIYLNV